MPASRRPYHDIGQLLHNARAGLGTPGSVLSQEDTAHAISVSVTTYGRWERGERIPERHYVRAISKALKIDRAELEEAIGRHEDAARPQLGPDLEETIYRMAGQIDQLQRMVTLLVTERAADLGVDVDEDPGEAFAGALEAGLLDPAQDRSASTEGSAPSRARRGRGQDGSPTSTPARAGAAGR